MNVCDDVLGGRTIDGCSTAVSLWGLSLPPGEDCGSSVGAVAVRSRAKRKLQWMDGRSQKARDRIWVLVLSSDTFHECLCVCLMYSFQAGEAFSGLPAHWIKIC
jgi:hypothetical protein